MTILQHSKDRQHTQVSAADEQPNFIFKIAVWLLRPIVLHIVIDDVMKHRILEEAEEAMEFPSRQRLNRLRRAD